jgi:iron complex transport system substrate-binding protein
MIRALAGAALVVALAAAPGRAEVRVTDDAGATVALAAPATRIVSLAPHATELVFAVGAGPRIVGTVDTSNFPAAARAIPRVGDVRALDLERIVALAPDLVVTWPWTAPAQVERLRARGVAVFTTNPATIDGIAADLERLGTLTGNADTGQRAAAAFRARLAALSARFAASPRVRVFYEIWGAPIYTVGGGHLITQAIAACGGENVFASLALPAPTVDVEAVLAAKPDAIVAGADRAARPAWLDDWRRWTSLPAVAHGNLFVVDADLLHRPGPRFLDGAAALCAALDDARRRITR